MAEQQAAKRHAAPREQARIVYERMKKGIKTDGCTMSPDLDFKDCCDKHDVDYALQNVSKWKADWDLRKCMSKKGYWVLPWVYWGAVSTVGWLFWQKGKKENEEEDATDA